MSEIEKGEVGPLLENKKKAKTEKLGYTIRYAHRRHREGGVVMGSPSVLRFANGDTRRPFRRLVKCPVRYSEVPFPVLVSGIQVKDHPPST